MIPDTVREALEAAALATLDGSPHGPLLAQRMKRACEDTLRALRLRGRVEVLGGGREVRIGIQDGPRVQTVVLRVD